MTDFHILAMKSGNWAKLGGHTRTEVPSFHFPSNWRESIYLLSLQPSSDNSGHFVIFGVIHPCLFLSFVPLFESS